MSKSDSILNKLPIIIAFTFIISGLSLSYAVENKFMLTLSMVGIVMLFGWKKLKKD